MQGLQETLYACLLATWDSNYRNSRLLNRSTVVLECWFQQQSNFLNNVIYLYLTIFPFDRKDHTIMTAPLPVCSAKLSMIWTCQYYGGGPRWNPSCSSFCPIKQYILLDITQRTTAGIYARILIVLLLSFLEIFPSDVLFFCSVKSCTLLVPIRFFCLPVTIFFTSIVLQYVPGKCSNDAPSYCVLKTWRKQP